MGDNLKPLAYHVLLEGRRMGPYDRRTIVGLRIKKTLTSEHQLEASDGSRLSVADLLGTPQPNAEFNALRTGNYTAAKVTRSAWLVDRERGPADIPPFVGEIEVRVHSDVLRIAGKQRRLFGVKDGRVKLPLKDIAFFSSSASRLDLWLRAGKDKLQRFALDLFSPEAVAELVYWMPDVKPWPDKRAGANPDRGTVAGSPLLWVAVFGVVMVGGLVLLVLLRRRF
jgi:hypothetical protein